VHTLDEPSTFARICAALETLDLTIHDARIYSDADGSTLDTFFVLKSDGSSLDSHPDTFQEIEDRIRRHLSEPGLKAVSRHTPRTVKAFTIPTSVEFSQDATSHLTTLEITTADRPGLLARVGSVLSRHDVSVQGAKIQTLGERVEDIFFLADAAGGQLREEALFAKLESELIEALGTDQQKDSAISELSI
jgi:[protein-PII] uridylyltransferase